MSGRRQLWFALAAVIVLVAGGLGARRLIRSRPKAKTVSRPVIGRLVRTLEVKKEEKTFWITGYGSVRPKTEITLAPEVSGRVVRRSPGFRGGGFIRKGDLLFEIDPASYQLALDQRKAQIAQIEADIGLLRQEEKNHKSDLTISRRQLKIARAELERNRRLRRQGVISLGQLDASQQALLSQERTLQSVQNALALVPSLVAQKKAALAVTRAQLGEAKLNLGRTKVYAPFDGRVREAKVEVGGYARSGEAMGVIHDTASLEVPVSIPMEEARWAFRRVQGVTHFPRSQEEVQKFFPAADVLWTRFGETFRWEGRVTLVEAGLDEATRALTLVVEVADPLRNWAPGKHPPLLVGMFVRVRIKGVTVPGVFVIPRAALHSGDRVFILKSGRLDIRKVQVIRKEQGEAVVRNGLSEGERLILSSIPAPVKGMRLRISPGGGNGARLAKDEGR
ncbi:MAG: HlyD family efflux transporter periplasmic adaptor subunit [bacterium]